MLMCLPTDRPGQCLMGHVVDRKRPILPVASSLPDRDDSRTGQARCAYAMEFDTCYIKTKLLAEKGIVFKMP